MRALTTTVMDVLGVACVAAFAWFVWPPLVLVAVGVGLLLASWRLSTEGRDS